jgi:SAM-dependent methyltransferase
MSNNIHEEVQNYYGKELKQTSDLKTNACCTLIAPPKHVMEALRNVHDEVQAKYYGCGLTIPNQLEGLRILDLGSGSGRDCYLAAQLVGEKGAVVGVDMTDEQLAVANKHLEYHRVKFGFQNSNVTFLKGNIEHLDELGFELESFDLIISNCVLNLVSDKQKVLNDAFKLLKKGGEMYFSDVYADRRFPKTLQNNPILWGECLSGALYWNDFLNYAKNAGFTDPRVVENKPISVSNQEIEVLMGDINVYSVTYRLFKIEGLESDCEDYGQAVCYNGSTADAVNAFDLDDHHHFPKGKVMTVCGNTYKMLHDTRYRDAFDFYGNWETHYGIFEGCGGKMPFTMTNDSGEAASCC